MSFGSFPHCVIKPFTKEETCLYLSKKSLAYDADVLYEITHYNPWFLSILPSVPVSRTEMIGKVQVEILKYIKSLFDSFKLISLENWVSRNLEDTNRWLYKAANGVPLTNKDWLLFYTSWVYLEYICQPCEKEGMVVCNLPYIHKLLLNELAKLRKKRKIPSSPIVNGYIFEEFFQEVYHHLHYYIEAYSFEDNFTFQVDYLHTLQNGEILASMENGVLYHLRYNHPVIDAVGLLRRKDKKKYYLVFIQVSMSKY